MGTQLKFNLELRNQKQICEAVFNQFLSESVGYSIASWDLRNLVKESEGIGILPDNNTLFVTLERYVNLGILSRSRGINSRNLTDYIYKLEISGIKWIES